MIFTKSLKVVLTCPKLFFILKVLTKIHTNFLKCVQLSSMIFYSDLKQLFLHAYFALKLFVVQLNMCDISAI